MRFTPTEVPGVIVIEPDVYRDQRGFFLETYHAEKYRAGGLPAPFVQDNQSCSERDTLRGLHLQVRTPQGKLVRVVRGRDLGRRRRRQAGLADVRLLGRRQPLGREFQAALCAPPDARTASA